MILCTVITFQRAQLVHPPAGWKKVFLFYDIHGTKKKSFYPEYEGTRLFLKFYVSSWFHSWWPASWKRHLSYVKLFNWKRSNTVYMQAATPSHLVCCTGGVQYMAPSSWEVINDDNAKWRQKRRYVFMHHGIIKHRHYGHTLQQTALWYFYVYLQARIYNSGNYILITKLINVIAYTKA